MAVSILLVDYIRWHYTRAFKDIGATWLNFAWFVTHFFSMSLLLRTFFSPWKRVTETYGRRGVGDFFATVFINAISRLIGALVRGCILLFGLLTFVILTAGLILFLLMWIVFPILPFISFVVGLKFLII